MAILETKHLTKTFGGVKAINNLSVAITKGSITGIIGPNGSGKTTLINTLTGTLALDEGAVVISDTELKRINTYDISSYGITRTFQTIRLFEQMSALDNILVVLTERNVFGALFERHGEYHIKKAEGLLKKTGLWEKRNENAENLSYGQRKLLEITRALAMDAEIYLLDEPFSGLFPQMRKIVTQIIKGLRQQGKTVVLIEHDVELIRSLADHIFVLDEGKLIAEGAPSEVLKNPKVIGAYLGD